MDQRQREVEIAVEAVRRAARVTRTVQRRLVTVDALQKKDRSPVTVADFASQAVVCHWLGEQLPDDPVIGEEDSSELRGEGEATLRSTVVEQVTEATGRASESEVLRWIDRGGAEPNPLGRFWTLDPIDGTKGFLRGEQYAIALALIEQGKVTVGVLGCPNLLGPDGESGLLMVAVAGEGTRALPLDGEGLNGAEASRVSDVSDPTAASFCESVESGHSDQGQSAQIARELGISTEPVRMDSQAKYAALARGSASIYLRLPTQADYREKIWDHAAGMLVVEEAGGKVTDVMGLALDFSQGRKLERNQGIVATNGRVHEAVLNAVRQTVTV